MEEKYNSNSHNFKALKIWQQSMELTSNVYRVSADFPAAERFGLTSQMRRCAVSIPSNIAEGSGRFSSKSFHHFLTIALGSLNELETQLLIAVDLNFCQETDLESLMKNIHGIQRMIVAMMRNAKNQDHTASDAEVHYQTNHFSVHHLFKEIDLFAEIDPETSYEAQYSNSLSQNHLEYPNTQAPQSKV